MEGKIGRFRSHTVKVRLFMGNSQLPLAVSTGSMYSTFQRNLFPVAGRPQPLKQRYSQGAGPPTLSSWNRKKIKWHV